MQIYTVSFTCLYISVTVSSKIKNDLTRYSQTFYIFIPFNSWLKYSFILSFSFSLISSFDCPSSSCTNFCSTLYSYSNLDPLLNVTFSSEHSVDIRTKGRTSVTAWRIFKTCRMKAETKCYST